jgi:hypothetical protein
MTALCFLDEHSNDRRPNVAQKLEANSHEYGDDESPGILYTSMQNRSLMFSKQWRVLCTNSRAGVVTVQEVKSSEPTSIPDVKVMGIIIYTDRDALSVYYCSTSRVERRRVCAADKPYRHPCSRVVKKSRVSCVSVVFSQPKCASSESAHFRSFLFGLAPHKKFMQRARRIHQVAIKFPNTVTHSGIPAFACIHNNNRNE